MAVRYVLESTADFSQWGLVERGVSPTGMITVTAPMTGEALFYRVREEF